MFSSENSSLYIEIDRGIQSNHEQYEKLPIDLKHSSSNPHYTYLSHHACPDKYEHELGIEPMEMKYQCCPCIDQHHFSSSKHTLVPINDNIDERPSPAMDVVDLSMIASFNQYYNVANSSELYGNEYGDQ